MNLTPLNPVVGSHSVIHWLYIQGQLFWSKYTNSLNKWLNKHIWALAAVAQWIEHWPVNLKVTGLIPNQGTCLVCGPGSSWGSLWGNQPINVFPSFSLPSPLKISPGWCGSVDWAPACEAKGHQFDSQSGHMSGLQARSLTRGTWEATAHWCFSPSLPLCKINM